MANATIPLAKVGPNFNKLSESLYLSQKIDGVPIRVDMFHTPAGNYNGQIRSRSGKPVPSCRDFIPEISRVFSNGPANFTIVGEVTVKGLTNFKDISGVVRRQEPQDNLILNIFDFHLQDSPDLFLIERFHLLRTYYMRYSESVVIIPQTFVRGSEEAKVILNETLFENPDWEGMIIRDSIATFAPGTRRWDYQKVINDPTVEIEISYFIEARSANGEPLGMVGAMRAHHNGVPIKISAGRLSHKERQELWKEYRDLQRVNRVAIVKYKRDFSYNALRQPTFQRWK